MIFRTKVQYKRRRVRDISAFYTGRAGLLSKNQQPLLAWINLKQTSFASPSSSSASSSSKWWYWWWSLLYHYIRLCHCNMVVEVAVIVAAGGGCGTPWYPLIELNWCAVTLCQRPGWVEFTVKVPTEKLVTAALFCVFFAAGEKMLWFFNVFCSAYKRE